MLHAWFASAVADPVFFGTKLLLIGGILGLLASLVRTRCQTVIEDWASRGGWSIVSCRWRLFDSQGFAWKPGMPLYRVRLENASGTQREAYIRCGNFALSVLSDELAVEWVEPARR